MPHSPTDVSNVVENRAGRYYCFGNISRYFESIVSWYLATYRFWQLNSSLLQLNSSTWLLNSSLWQLNSSLWHENSSWLNRLQETSHPSLDESFSLWKASLEIQCACSPGTTPMANGIVELLMLLKKLLQKNYRLLKSCLQQLYLNKMMTQLLHLVFVFTPAANLVWTNSKAKVTNSIANGTNSIANGTNSFANGTNSFANRIFIIRSLME